MNEREGFIQNSAAGGRTKSAQKEPGPPIRVVPANVLGDASGLGEDAHATGADQQTNNDQHDAPEELPPEEREDAGDHQNDCEDPEEKTHAIRIPARSELKTLLRGDQFAI